MDDRWTEKAKSETRPLARSQGASRPRKRHGHCIPGPNRLACAVLLLGSCQAYEPRPLDRDADRAAWHRRTLEGGAVQELVDRLGAQPTEPMGDFDPADGLTLQEGVLVALVFNPQLRLARLRAAQAAAGAEHAGLWSDPQLSVGVLRILESVPDPWVLLPSLTFTLPLSGGLEAEADLADAQASVALQQAREAEWALQRDARRAWLAWSAARLRVAETARLVDAMDGLVRSARQLADRGELPRTEAALFGVEQAQRRNQLRGLRGELAQREQEVRALLGLAPEAPVSFLPTLEVRADADDLQAEGADRIEACNPTLSRLRLAFDASEESLRREIRRQYPDLTLGPLYEYDAGQSRLGLFGGLPLPLLNANRRAIAEAEVARELARVAVEAEYEALVGRWVAATARLAAVSEQRAELEQVVVPLVDRQLEDAARLLRLGEGTSLVLLESLTRAYQTKLALIETREQEAATRVEITFLLGPRTHRPTPLPDEEKS